MRVFCRTIFALLVVCILGVPTFAASNRQPSHARPRGSQRAVPRGQTAHPPYSHPAPRYHYRAPQYGQRYYRPHRPYYHGWRYSPYIVCRQWVPGHWEYDGEYFWIPDYYAPCW